MDVLQKLQGRQRCCKQPIVILLVPLFTLPDRYPPTPSHLELLLSLFHEALTDGKDFLHQKTTFSVTPSLIVLCEPSAYFLETHQATYERNDFLYNPNTLTPSSVSSYLTVISECLSLINSLSAQRSVHRLPRFETIDFTLVGSPLLLRCSIRIWTTYGCLS